MKKINVFEYYLINLILCSIFTINKNIKETKSKIEFQIKICILTLDFQNLQKNIEHLYYNDFFKNNYHNWNQFINNSSFISENYISWLKLYNMKYIPINIKNDIQYNINKLYHCQGLLLTGGAEPFYVFEFDDKESKKFDIEPSKYLKLVKSLIEEVKKINNNGTFFPIWGTCLGFESILVAESDFKLHRKKVKNNVFDFEKLYILDNESMSYNYFDQKYKKIIKTQKTSFFHHNFGFYLNDKDIQNLIKQKEIIPISYIIKKNKKILTWFEYKKYPIFATQYHPEIITDPKNSKKFSKIKNFKKIKKINQKYSNFIYTILIDNKSKLNYYTKLDNDNYQIDKVTMINDIGIYSQIRVYTQIQI